eukprot:symbB.v1.2.007431.t1/scaffold454.1/size202171/5
MAYEMTGAPSERYGKLVVCGAKERGLPDWYTKHLEEDLHALGLPNRHFSCHHLQPHATTAAMQSTMSHVAAAAFLFVEVATLIRCDGADGMLEIFLSTRMESKDAVPVDETQSARVRVCVRFRPVLPEESGSSTRITWDEEAAPKKVHTSGGRSDAGKTFEFDRVFPPQSSQKEVVLQGFL